MKISIKRFDRNIPLPKYSTVGSAGVDLYSRKDTVVKSGKVGYIPLNVVVDIPRGYFGLLAARSSTHKIGLIPANGVGVLDSDFSGNNDEPYFIVYNFTKEDVRVEKGTRVAQMLLLKYENFEFEEVGELENKDRGGIGSTGRK